MTNEKRAKSGDSLANLRTLTEVLKESTEKLRHIAEKQKVTNATLQLALTAMKEALAGTKAALERLRDLENTFPRTQQFLRSRGLNDVRQLDSEGWKALSRHYRSSLDSPSEDPSPKLTVQVKGGNLLN